MKIITIVLSSIIISACGGKKATTTEQDVKSPTSIENPVNEQSMEQEDSMTLEYSAITRGSYKHVRAADEKLLVQRNNRDLSQDISCSKEQWGKLVDLMKSLQLEGLQNLKAPSKAHQYDGALAATLSITKDGKTYQTSTFDHGKPPKEIEALVTYLLSLSKVE